MGMVNFVKKWYGYSQVVINMLLVQVITTGLQLLSKVILNQGTFIFSYLSYRNIIASFCIAPFAFYFERDLAKKLDWSTWIWLFFNALVGITMGHGFFYYGLADTTATYATNFLNLIPIATFVISTIFGMEKVGLGSKAGKLKIFGATLCLGGALIISLYKGKGFNIGHQHFNPKMVTKHSKPHLERGTIFLACSTMSYATWFIIQVKLMRVFPYKYWVTLLTCIIGSIQTTLIGLCLTRDKDAWKLGWNLQLITIVYAGALASAATFCLVTWAVAKKGPTYPSMFNPLALIFVAILETLILGQQIRVGSLLGMTVIIVGIYSFLFGKNKEIAEKQNIEAPNSTIDIKEEAPMKNQVQ